MKSAQNLAQPHQCVRFSRAGASTAEIKLLILPTKQAIKELKQKHEGNNAVLHVTC